MRCRVVAALALSVVAVAAAGCGGSEKPLTRAELTAKANAICKTVSAKLASRTINAQSNIGRVASELASFEQSELTKLSKLVPPAELESDWKRFIAGAQTLAENTSKLGELAKAHNLSATHGLVVSSERVQRQMMAIAKRDGLTACQQVP
jgi:uridine phosphorylase